MLLISVSIVCGCAGSTTGGIKTDRFLLAIKTLRLRFSLQQHPNAVVRVRIDGNVLDDKIASTAVVFIVAYFLALLAACMGNVGPGFGMVGSLGNYSDLPAVMKFSNTMLMLLGRLEIFGLVQLFFLKWWR